ncbi:DUF1877 family protein [Candidatus Obscuribacterales bacterium]|nr:DUF1877 family protein [Candidatus Obscuribacterales bacterium]
MGVGCCLLAINEDIFNEIIEGDHSMLGEIINDDDDDDEFALDWTWPGIDFLIRRTEAGRNQLLSFLTSGGIPIQFVDEDSGVEEIRAFSRSEVATIERALAAISEIELRECFDAEEMKKSLKTGVFESESALESLCTDFFELRNFMTESSAANKALLQFYF